MHHNGGEYRDCKLSRLVIRRQLFAVLWMLLVLPQSLLGSVGASIVEVDRTVTTNREFNVQSSVPNAKAQTVGITRRNSDKKLDINIEENLSQGVEQENKQQRQQDQHERHRRLQTLTGHRSGVTESVEDHVVIRQLRAISRKSRAEDTGLQTDFRTDTSRRKEEILGTNDDVSERLLNLAPRAHDKNDSFGSMSEVTRSAAVSSGLNRDVYDGRAESKRNDRNSSFLHDAASSPLIGGGILVEDDYKVGITDSPEIDAVFADLLLEKRQSQKVTETAQIDSASNVDVFKTRWMPGERRRRSSRSDRRRGGRQDTGLLLRRNS